MKFTYRGSAASGEVHGLLVQGPRGGQWTTRSRTGGGGAKQETAEIDVYGQEGRKDNGKRGRPQTASVITAAEEIKGKKAEPVAKHAPDLHIITGRKNLFSLSLLTPPHPILLWVSFALRMYYGLVLRCLVGIVVGVSRHMIWFLHRWFGASE